MALAAFLYKFIIALTSQRINTSCVCMCVHPLALVALPPMHITYTYLTCPRTLPYVRACSIKSHIATIPIALPAFLDMFIIIALTSPRNDTMCVSV